MSPPTEVYELGEVHDRLNALSAELTEALHSPPFLKNALSKRKSAVEVEETQESEQKEIADEAAMNTALLKWVYKELAQGFGKWRESIRHDPVEANRVAVALWIKVNSSVQT